MDQSTIYSNLPLTIHQVEKVTGVNKSTLRFWEKSFSHYLEIQRTGGKQRQYAPSDVQKVLTLKTLLKDEMYTILGAKKKLGLLDGESVADGNELLRRMARRAGGETIRLDLLRGEKKLSRTVALRARTEIRGLPEGPAAPPPPTSQPASQPSTQPRQRPL